MRDVLQAEVAAREAVEAARVRAAQIVEAARIQAADIESIAEQRVHRINAGSEQACAGIYEKAQQEREIRLNELKKAGEVKLDAAALERAVRDFALGLISGTQDSLRNR